MAGKISDLASRFKAALNDTPEEVEQAAPEIDEGLRTRAREARAELLVELGQFATAIGGSSKKTKSGITITREEFTLKVKTESDAGLLLLDYPNADEIERIYPVLEGDELEWLYETNHRLVPLLEEGLEDLMVNALGLPRPRRQAAASAKTAPGKVASGNVEDVLKERARDKRAKLKERGHTRTIGKNKEVWDNRPTNPGQKTKKKREPTAAEKVRIKSTENPTSDAWAAHTVRTTTENPRRFREFKGDENQSVGGTVKEYKGII
jgi:hypothetical protein